MSTAPPEPALFGVGASAGGVESLFAIVAARHGEPVVAGRVYVAPPDHHLLADDGHLAVTRGPKENGHRPGVDPLFRSLAHSAGPSAVGVVLSGMLDDGAAGLLAVVRHGGTAVVQDPDDALHASMPSAALSHVPGAVVAPASKLAAIFAEIAVRPRLGVRRATDALAFEVAVSRGDPASVSVDPPGPAAGLSCPDCGGPLFDLSEEHLLHYRCRVGHAWSQESLDVEQDDRVENALYSALQALEEKSSLQHRIAEVAARSGAAHVVERARESAHRAIASAGTVRALLAGREGEDAR